MTELETRDEIEELLALASVWADEDCDQPSGAQAREMVARRNLAELREHFAGRLEFGTAGLRALVGPGPTRMNLATIRRVSFAVGSYLVEGTPSPRVVLAYDARASSFGFARECAGVLGALGVSVVYFAQPTPTPLCAFAVRHLGADAGIVVTASHNPKEYNGFKLYAADGCQIIPPVDADIAARMASAPPARQIACVSEPFSGEGLIHTSVEEAYYAGLRSLYRAKADNVVVAYTALHGVGGKVATRALEELGVRALHVVAQQQQPDASFSTVAFPNPEERGVMDLVVELAQRTSAHVALATDPDADRLGVAVRDDHGRMVQLSGNQVGVLLAYRALSRYTGERQALVVQSVVSSPMLAAMATEYGARYERTLTGFKWICRPALALSSHQYVFGYEEALGYAVSPIVLDKDGVSAAVALVELVADCEREGKTTAQLLFELYHRFGLWVSVQHTITLPGIEGARTMALGMEVLRRAPPTHVGMQQVTAVTDYLERANERPAWLGAADLVELQLGANGRVLVRPSGTEPKLKIYVDYRGDAPPSFEQYFAKERALSAECRELGVELARWMKL